MNKWWEDEPDKHEEEFEDQAEPADPTTDIFTYRIAQGIIAWLFLTAATFMVYDFYLIFIKPG